MVIKRNEFSKSTTLKLSGQFGAFFDNVNANGQLAEDTVVIAGRTLLKQQFAVVQHLSGEGQLPAVDGVLGVSFGTNGTEFRQDDLESPVHSLARSLGNNKFTVWFNPAEKPAADKKGALLFGEGDATHCEGPKISTQVPPFENKGVGLWVFGIDG